MSEGKLEIITQENNYDILIEAIVNEAYIELYFIQHLKYTGFSLGEFSLNLNKIEELQFTDLEFEKEDKKIKSTLIKKKNDEDEIYTDSLASGNTTIHIKDDIKFNKYSIKIGNAEPGKIMILKYHFIQKLKFDDLNYIYQLFGFFPHFNDNDYPRSLKANIRFETFNTITKLEPKIYQANPKIRFKFNDVRKIEAEVIIKNIDYSIEPIMSFEFQTQDYRIPKLFSQYDPINNETSFLLRNVEKKENIKASPGYYYFLFNENGQNNLELNDLQKILKIFLNSLPEESYYQLIGLGTYMKLYNIKPLKYSVTNYQRIINKINMENIPKSNNIFLQNNINLKEVIEYIYDSGENNNIPKYIFILNSYSNNIFRPNMMEQYKIHTNKFHIYEFKFCNHYIQASSLTQNGITSYNYFFDEEQLKEIIKKLISYMNNYYNDVNYDIINKNSNEVLYDFKNENYLIENQIKNYYFMIKGKIDGTIDINNKYILNNNNYETKLSFDDKNITNINEGNTLAKIIINNIIQNNKNGNNDKSKLLSKKYQILGEHTSLLCEIKNQENIYENIELNTKENNNNANQISNNTSGVGLFGLFKDPTLNTSNQPLFGNVNPNNNINNNQTASIFQNSTLNTSSQPLFGYYPGDLSSNTHNQENSLFGNNK